MDDVGSGGREGGGDEQQQGGFDRGAGGQEPLERALALLVQLVAAPQLPVRQLHHQRDVGDAAVARCVGHVLVLEAQERPLPAAHHLHDRGGCRDDLREEAVLGALDLGLEGDCPHQAPDQVREDRKYVEPALLVAAVLSQPQLGKGPKPPSALLLRGPQAPDSSAGQRKGEKRGWGEGQRQGGRPVCLGDHFKQAPVHEDVP